MKTPLTLPTLHENGTSPMRLAGAYENARDHLSYAERAIKQTAPNPRDYPGLDLARAEAEHLDRLRRLVDLIDEIETLIVHCGGD